MDSNDDDDNSFSSLSLIVNLILELSPFLHFLAHPCIVGDVYEDEINVDKMDVSEHDDSIVNGNEYFRKSFSGANC